MLYHWPARTASAREAIAVMATETVEKQGQRGGIPQRRALVVGIDAYAVEPLGNAISDVKMVRTALSRRGFQVTCCENIGRDDLEMALADFASTVDDADIALIYLAGHAVERFGSGFFLPRDFELPASPIKVMQRALALDAFVEATKSAKARVVVLDACRNWPEDSREASVLEQALDEQRAGHAAWSDLILAYSTSSARRASDGPDGEGSEFCRAFCKLVADHSLDVDACFRAVSDIVTSSSPSRQQPWTYSSLRRSLSFSDLPRFAAVQRHAIPNPGIMPIAWCAPGAPGVGIFAGADRSAVWHVDVAGTRMQRFAPDRKMVGAVAIPGRPLFVDESGDVFDERNAILARSRVNPSYGVVASPSGARIAVYGKRAIQVYERVKGKLRRLRRIDAGNPVYCAAFVTEELLWCAGQSGLVVEVELATGNRRNIGELRAPVNAMTLSFDSKRAYLACQGGILADADVHTGSLHEWFEGRRPQTAAGVRAALAPTTDDETIRTYLFEPHRLRRQIRRELDCHVEPVALVSCAHAPALPLLAVGTNESTVVLFDTRDRQTVQTIEVGAGHVGGVVGVAFLDDARLVVVDSSGNVQFLYGQAGTHPTFAQRGGPGRPSSRSLVRRTKATPLS